MNELYAHLNSYYMDNHKFDNDYAYTEVTNSNIYSNERVRDSFWGFHMPRQTFKFYVNIKEMSKLKKTRTWLNKLEFESVGNILLMALTSGILVHDGFKLWELYKAL